MSTTDDCSMTAPSTDELIAQLRKRAEDERKIQANNEAVADALQGQLDAFDRRDGSHNTFAVRLGLSHRNCAKNDANLAADWDAAADHIDALRKAAEGMAEALEAAAGVLDGESRYILGIVTAALAAYEELKP